MAPEMLAHLASLVVYDTHRLLQRHLHIFSDVAVLSGATGENCSFSTSNTYKH